MAKVSKGIVVTTSEFSKDWLAECIISVGDKYPVLLVCNGGYVPNISAPHITKIINDWNGFELGGIIRGKEYFDEFIHLMDTTIIKDTSMFDKLFEMSGHVFLTYGGYHYMGKFISKDLPEIPKIHEKRDAIDLELHWLGRAKSYFTPNLPVHTDVFQVKHGRKNMVLENDYMIKYKATWSL